MCVFHLVATSGAQHHSVSVGDTSVSTCVGQQHLGTQHSPNTSSSGLSLFTDVDECAVNNGHCEHNCSNELGGYSCQCASGYQLDQDGRNCTGKTQRRVLIPSRQLQT